MMRGRSLLTTVMVPLVLVVGLGYVFLSAYVERSTRADLVGLVDDELLRATNDSPVTGAPGATPGPVSASGDDAPAIGRAQPVPEAVPVFGTDGLSEDVAPFRFVIGQDDTLQQDGSDGLFDTESIIAVAEGSGPATLDAIDGSRYRARRVEMPGRPRGVIALPLAQVDETMTAIRRNLVAGGVAVAVLQLLVVWMTLRAAVRPVRQMAQRASLIADGQLDVSLSEHAASTEVSELSTSLDQMLDTIRSMISERDQNLAAVAQTNAKLERFVADASHELRTPLAGLSGYAQLHAGGMLDDPVDLDRAMARIGAESVRMGALVEALLDLTRLGQDGSEEPELVDLRTIANNVGSDLLAAHPERKLTVRADTEAVVHGMSGELHQAVLNLGSNALHHSDTSVELVVASTRNGSHEVQVIDHGAGISAEHGERIFDPFFRVDSARSRERGGAGLGLALVKAIAERHDGTVSLSETAGGGATFVLRIPTAL